MRFPQRKGAHSTNKVHSFFKISAGAPKLKRKTRYRFILGIYKNQNYYKFHLTKVGYKFQENISFPSSIEAIFSLTD